MPKSILPTSVALALSTACCAQIHTAGFNFNVAPGATTRNGVTTAAELMGRIDFDDYRGLDETVDGFRVIVQDQDILASPGELFDFFMYDEDPLTPDYPNLVPGTAPGTTAILGSLGITGPTVASPGSTTVGAALVSITFTTPATIPQVNTDLFVSFSVPAAPNWPNDGLSVQISLGTNPMFPPPNTNTFDIAGPAPIPQNTYGLVHDILAAGIAYGGPRQLMFDLLTDLPSGVVTAITTQTSYPLSNVAPGTASFFSGLHPDATLARADDIGYVYFDPGLTPGSLVFFLADFDFFPFPVPISSFVPGSVGGACVSLGAQLVRLSISTGAQEQSVITVPTAFRSVINGSNFVFDAVSVDAVSGQIRGGYCGKQHF